MTSVPSIRSPKSLSIAAIDSQTTEEETGKSRRGQLEDETNDELVGRFMPPRASHRHFKLGRPLATCTPPPSPFSSPPQLPLLLLTLEAKFGKSADYIENIVGPFSKKASNGIGEHILILLINLCIFGIYREFTPI